MNFIKKLLHNKQIKYKIKLIHEKKLLLSKLMPTIPPSNGTAITILLQDLEVLELEEIQLIRELQ